jgi:enoyl-CoA hydratase
MAGETAEVRVERSGPVTTVYLNRPARRNAVDGPTAARLAAAFREFDADPDAAVAVLHGEGGVFCSGADLTAIGTERGNRVTPDGDGPMGVSRLRLGKPVIAAVSGYAVAGGLELALWCDLRVADETAVFGVFCRRWGVPLIDGGTVRLPRLIGTSRAMDMILTGRPVDAAEAAAIGLANRVVPPGRALAAARELAAQLAAFPQACLRSDRASVLAAEGIDESAALASEYRHGLTALESDALDGVARFVSGEGRHGAGALRHDRDRAGAAPDGADGGGAVELVGQGLAGADDDGVGLLLPGDPENDRGRVARDGQETGADAKLVRELDHALLQLRVEIGVDHGRQGGHRVVAVHRAHRVHRHNTGVLPARHAEGVVKCPLGGVRSVDADDDGTRSDTHDRLSSWHAEILA